MMWHLRYCALQDTVAVLHAQVTILYLELLLLVYQLLPVVEDADVNISRNLHFLEAHRMEASYVLWLKNNTKVQQC